MTQYQSRYAVKRLWTYRNDDDRTTGWQVIDLGCIASIADGQVVLDNDKLSQVNAWGYVLQPTFGNNTLVIKGFSSLEFDAADSLAKAMNDEAKSHNFFELTPAQLKELNDSLLDPV